MREAGVDVQPVLFDWHHGLRGVLLTDLMGFKKNRLAACRLARKLGAMHRAYPHRKINIIAHSGGCGMAAFTLERIKHKDIVDTLILLAPALSPRYNLAPTLARVRRCYATFSKRDVFFLSIGTRLFGTMDRIYTRSAGLIGFYRPVDATPDTDQAYQKLRQIRWDHLLKAQGHAGGHADWIIPRFLKQHVPALLRDEPLLPCHVGFISGSRSTPKPSATRLM